MNSITEPAIVAEMRGDQAADIVVKNWVQDPTVWRPDALGHLQPHGTNCRRYYLPAQPAINPGPAPVAPAPPNPLPRQGRCRPSNARRLQQEQYDAAVTAHGPAMEAYNAALAAHNERIEQYERDRLPNPDLDPPDHQTYPYLWNKLYIRHSFP